jgi:serpin B
VVLGGRRFVTAVLGLSRRRQSAALQWAETIPVLLGLLVLLLLCPVVTWAEEGKADLRFQDANTRFAFKLFNELQRQNAGQNLLISPIGIESSLALVLNGAAGDTQKAMLRALELQDLSLTDIDKAHDRLRISLENPDPKVELTIANSIWAQKGTIFKPDFTRHGLEFFHAEITGVDFAAPSALRIINHWLRSRTKERIQQIVDKVDPETVLLLLNAVYFKGKWTVPFDKKLTKEGDFTPAKGRPKKMPMMSQTGKFSYFHGDAFQAVSLPYGKGRIRMDLFLPDQNSSLDQFSKDLTAENWKKWIPLFKETPGEIVLPRFKVEYETDLNDTLKILGMGDAFDQERANFDNLTPTGKIFVSRIRHKASTEVNEEGTEAAATTVELHEGAKSPDKPKEETFRMVVDRPFFLIVRDSQTGTIFFMGSVADPK